jgi:hypothetical protein
VAQTVLRPLEAPCANVDDERTLPSTPHKMAEVELRIFYLRTFSSLMPLHPKDTRKRKVECSDSIRSKGFGKDLEGRSNSSVWPSASCKPEGTL